MAQGSSKSRIIIWTIVGILVVVAVVFLLVGKKGAAPAGARTIQTEQIAGLVSKMETRIQKFEERVVKAAPPPDVQQRIGEQVAKVRQEIQEFQGLTDPTQLYDKWETVKKDMADARKMLTDAGGDAGTEEGGE